MPKKARERHKVRYNKKGSPLVAKRKHQQREKQRAKQKRKLKEERCQAQQSFVRKGLDGRVLLVGEADFSFSLALTRQIYSRPKNSVLVATSLESLGVLKQKYGKSALERTIGEIVSVGAGCVQVRHGIDAMRLTDSFSKERFNRVVFNFPHTGSQRVHENRALLTAFFKSCVNVLLPRGTVEVTLKICPPYSRWDIESCAEEASFVLVDVKNFDFRDYPGYKHRTTEPDAKQLKPELHCKTFVFMTEHMPSK